MPNTQRIGTAERVQGTVTQIGCCPVTCIALPLLESTQGAYWTKNACSLARLQAAAVLQNQTPSDSPLGTPRCRRSMLTRASRRQHSNAGNEAATSRAAAILV